MKRRFWVILSLLVIFAASGLAQQPQPLYFTSVTDPPYYQPLPMTFWIYHDPPVPGQEGWLIHVVGTGPDELIDPPILGYGNPLMGMPSGDDFLAHPVQNGFSQFYFNGVEIYGSGYEGTFATEQPLICLPPGQGVEPVINVGDFMYFRCFDAPDLTSALWYGESHYPFMIQYTTPGIPDTVFNIQLEQFMWPVEMTLFTATGGDNKVTLHWVTATEKENDHFNLYKAVTEAGEYSLIAQIEGQGTTPLEHHYFYEDLQVVNGCKYYYQIADVDINGVEEFYDQKVTATPGGIGSGIVAEDYELMQNYPNPFNASTAIGFKVLEPGHVKLAIYDLLGREIAVLIDGDLENNTYEVIFEAGYLPAGVYFYELVVNEYRKVEKMVLVK